LARRRAMVTHAHTDYFNRIEVKIKKIKKLIRKREKREERRCG